MTVHNWTLVAVSVLQLGAAVEAGLRGNWKIAVLMVGVGIANGVTATIKA